MSNAAHTRQHATAPTVFRLGRKPRLAFDSFNPADDLADDQDEGNVEKIAKAFSERMSPTDLKALIAVLTKLSSENNRAPPSTAMDAKPRDFSDRFPATRRIRIW